MSTRHSRFILAGVLAALLLPATAGAQWRLTDGLAGASGSTVGPDGALYVTEGLAGQITRVDPWTGDQIDFGTNLPQGGELIPGLGGPADVAFVDGVAYVLVNLVNGCFGGPATMGIYEMQAPDHFEVLADLGTFNNDNPPATPFDLACGVPYGIEAFRGGLLVTDGHLNRVLWVSLNGDIHIFESFGNIVPTGLEVHGNRVYVAQAGPSPHDPADGKIVSIDARSGAVADVGSGAPLLVDVEFGLGRTMYALAQGEWCPPGETPPLCGKFPGAPAEPNGGLLVEVNADGSFTKVAGGLNLPTSMEFIGNSAYIVSLLGEIWVVDDVSQPPFGRKH
jgi:hypothetical protein